MATWKYAEPSKNVALVCKDATCEVYKVSDASGEGIMTSYAVMPGVWVLYHDFHMENCFSGFHPSVAMFCIDHCREGRLEWETERATYMYMEAGDIQINAREQPTKLYRFPLKHYHGLTVALALDEAGEQPFALLDGFPLDLRALSSKFCGGGRSFIMRACAQIEHVFSELYNIPEAIRAPMFRIKVLELLLFLCTVNVPVHTVERPYFHKSQVEKVKAMMELITANPTRHYTLAELSTQFEFPLTAMKACFKGVYGTSIYAYMKNFRMNLAAVELRKTTHSVTRIAQRMGYDNASKFASAFKSILQLTPAQYRRLGG